MEEYHERIADRQLAEMLDELPAVLIAGPKGVGKTHTARRLAAAEFALDNAAVRQSVEADPDRIQAAARPVLLDEWQRLPGIWDRVRRWVDDGAAAGSVVLTGSAHPRGAAIHSGAGRIVTLRMRPLSLAERQLGTPNLSVSSLLAGGLVITGETSVRLADYAREIVSSGFPRLRGLSDRARERQLDGYLGAVVEREFADQGMMIRATETLRGWLRSYAAATGTTASYTKILDGATVGDGSKPAKTTTIAYRDVLASLWLLDPVPPWTPPLPELGRLAQQPKHFLADPALAARLLEIDDDDLLAGRAESLDVVRAGGAGFDTLFGRLFEALVAQSLQVYAEACGATLHHLRTRNGDHEIDFVLTRKRSVVAVEVKLSPVVGDDDVAHLKWLSARLGDRLTDAVVVTTGTVAYRRRDGIGVIPAALLTV